ncbi:MAG: AbgT family transporter [Sphingomonadaceae bacterium]|uniref:AbgT family transporter n=1 Tax=Thermaurantiacus sp. TaxID=2820283 RepID=UPI00298ED757|nr:AbgT family transporter [Thermaurantiacus sp.]MCS6986720.1 AbgT family transporter [Sphingomonadaceae bacterium]MDW8414017.1 AbgT family transporter [Thermaurantiacus sp.]
MTALRRLPDAAILFLLLSLAVMMVSALAAAQGLALRHPATGALVEARSLLSADLMRRLLVEMPRTFAEFPPLGTVLTVLVGIGIAERSGLIGAALSAVVRRAPSALLPAAVVFAGILSSLASDAGFVVLPPLAAALFAAAGRHPVAGVAAAYAGVSGGYSANLFITALDPLLAGLTEAAARLIEPAATVPATANWSLMAALVPVLTAAGAWVNARFVEPRLGAWQPSGTDVPELAPEPATVRRGLVAAGWAAVGLLALGVGLAMPPEGVLRDPATGRLTPLLAALPALVMLGFAIVGLAYGVAAGTIRAAADAVRMAEGTLAGMATYILVAFVAAQFLALFAWSNLGALLAIAGGGWLQALGVGALPLLAGVVLLSGALNLIMPSASAKWALLAPVLVPMLMAAGIPPAATQAAYRVGDMGTNVIAPTMVYLPLLVAAAQRFSPGFGVGSLLALMWPYALVFLTLATVLLLLFVGLGVPLGPS